VARVAAAEGAEWLAQRCDEVGGGAPERRLFLAFSQTARKVGDAPLDLTDDDLAQAAEARSEWAPAGWTCDQAARALLLLQVPHEDPAAFVAILDKLFAAADLRELVALYLALPLLPCRERHVPRCAEGIRTNITSVFTAVAHHNPYPSEHLDESAWNQMVLKALFVGVSLGPIVGLDRRANGPLARMLCDYAHERWAASRAVSPELWRCVGPHADDAALADLERVLTTGDQVGVHAAALALRSCLRPEAAALLTAHASGVPEDLHWSTLDVGSAS